LLQFQDIEHYLQLSDAFHAL